jgi:hypothetical protein
MSTPCSHVLITAPLSDLPEGGAQTSGGEHYISDLPEGEAQSYGGYFDDVDFKI